MYLFINFTDTIVFTETVGHFFVLYLMGVSQKTLRFPRFSSVFFLPTGERTIMVLYKEKSHKPIRKFSPMIKGFETLKGFYTNGSYSCRDGRLKKVGFFF